MVKRGMLFNVIDWSEGQPTDRSLKTLRTLRRVLQATATKSARDGPAARNFSEPSQRSRTALAAFLSPTINNGAQGFSRLRTCAFRTARS